MIKKHNWLIYKSGGGSKGQKVEISIISEDNRRIDFFRTDNQHDFKRVQKVIYEKYGLGFKPEIEPKDSVTELNRKKEEDKEIQKEIDWLYGDDK